MEFWGRWEENSARGGKACHFDLDDCNYYGGWNGNHPQGKSRLCNTDSCLEVGISKEGASQIPDAVDATPLAWGTDANAFAQLADEYFREHQDALNLKGSEAEEADCQISYVIVIGDGAWQHGDDAKKN